MSERAAYLAQYDCSDVPLPEGWTWGKWSATNYRALHHVSGIKTEFGGTRALFKAHRQAAINCQIVRAEREHAFDVDAPEFTSSVSGRRFRTKDLAVV